MSESRLLVLGASDLLGSSVAVAAARAESGELHLLAGRGPVPAVPGAVVHRLDLRDLVTNRSGSIG